MLISLHIENIAVIKCADIDFNPGFTVLTGETGAGKSIIIDSINLILGARPSRELIRTGEDSALVSAMFGDINADNTASLKSIGITPDEDGMVFIQRNITADGKAQTRINGRISPVSVQREAASYLINIHGQHENQMLLDPSKHIIYLDRFADDGAELAAYETAYSAMNTVKHELSSLNRDDREKRRLIDMLTFQLADIDAAKLKDGEEEALEAQRNKIRNLEKLEKNIKLIYHSLYRSEKGMSSCDNIDRAIGSITQIGDIIPDSEAMIERLENYRYEIEDIAETVYAMLDDDIGDPTAALDKIESRLDVISKLKRKYGATIGEILEVRAKAAAELEELETSDERAEELRKQLEAAEAECSRLAAVLTEKRRSAAEILAGRITEELAYLDMAKTTFGVDIRSAAFSRSGGDEVEFMISTNAGEPLKPLGKIASGGELSRVMLAVKSVLADRENTETLIFDEIDTGISGKTSHKLGVKLRQIASCGQVLCVTHSAQIAALTQNHLYISKSDVNGRTETSVSPLDREGRINEVARIMGGEVISDTLLQTAREMVEYGDSLNAQTGTQ